jgi:hypothetical protein
VHGYRATIRSVIVPLMPIGVEHRRTEADFPADQYVIVPLMPIGVELRD